MNRVPPQPIQGDQEGAGNFTVPAGGQFASRNAIPLPRTDEIPATYALHRRKADAEAAVENIMRGPEPRNDQLLEQKVTEAFEARQEILRAELAHFQARLNQLNQQVQTRDKQKKAIIDRRIFELKNPQSGWAPTLVGSGNSGFPTALRAESPPVPFGSAPSMGGGPIRPMISPNSSMPAGTMLPPGAHAVPFGSNSPVPSGPMMVPAPFTQPKRPEAGGTPASSPPQSLGPVSSEPLTTPRAEVPVPLNAPVAEGIPVGPTEAPTPVAPSGPGPASANPVPYGIPVGPTDPPSANPTPSLNPSGPTTIPSATPAPSPMTHGIPVGPTDPPSTNPTSSPNPSGPTANPSATPAPMTHGIPVGPTDPPTANLTPSPNPSGPTANPSATPAPSPNPSGPTANPSATPAPSPNPSGPTAIPAATPTPSLNPVPVPVGPTDASERSTAVKSSSSAPDLSDANDLNLAGTPNKIPGIDPTSAQRQSVAKVLPEQIVDEDRPKSASLGNSARTVGLALPVKDDRSGGLGVTEKPTPQKKKIDRPTQSRMAMTAELLKRCPEFGPLSYNTTESQFRALLLENQSTYTCSVMKPNKKVYQIPLADSALVVTFVGEACHDIDLKAKGDTALGN